ncbi:MAG: hypothetical protein HOH04_03550 [Rhodospirillaceae bacterium]|nr:hypothetical protein [Rhodospirillaceae bacterium]
MPVHIKTILSLFTLIVGAMAHWYEKYAGNEQLSWVVTGLAVFMVLAIWVFPEAGSATDK